MTLRFICTKIVLMAIWSATTANDARADTEDRERGLNGLSEVPLEKPADNRVNALGAAALSIRPAEWRHAETKNFVYHFFHGFIATPVSVEAEFYYRIISADLARDTAQWERKCHVFIFEKPDDWSAFQKKAKLDPWTGGIHAGGELFILRDPSFKWKGNALGHEVAHLILHRFFGSGVPLWLNEGYAEYSSRLGYAAYYRARGFVAKPKSEALTGAVFVPLADLTSSETYPADEKAVPIFYIESEKLVRFLSREEKGKFVIFLDAMSKGNRIETALWKSYGGRFPSLNALEQEFRNYAGKDV
jgi:hypothetical protein